MSALPQQPYYMSVKNYLAFDRESDIKHEYADQKIYAMAGASENHNLICTSTTFSLYGQTRNRPCKIYQSDMRVQAANAESYRYPDITIVCGEAQFFDAELDTLVNPTVLIEVLSKSSSERDHITKAWEYRQITSLQDYLIIAPDKAQIEWYHRQKDNTWLISSIVGLTETIYLDAIDCTLALEDIYEKIDFDEDSEQ